MNYENFFKCLPAILNVPHEIRIVSVSAEGLDLDNLRAHLVGPSENIYAGVSLAYFSSERVFRHVSHCNYRVARVFYVVFQVMQYPSVFART